jgi:hypothetical protein
LEKCRAQVAQPEKSLPSIKGGKTTLWERREMGRVIAIPNFDLACNFLGAVDELPTNAKVGDVVHYNGTVWVYTGSEFEAFGVSRDKEKELPVTCERCGAPLNHGVCEYCGTDYR